MVSNIFLSICSSRLPAAAAAAAAAHLRFLSSTCPFVVSAASWTQTAFEFNQSHFDLIFKH
jgi:hypothetical protein